MTEIKVLMDEEQTEFEGLFCLSDIYKLIDEYTKQKGYDKKDTENTEKVGPKGKNCHLILEPNKLVTDYFKLIMKIEVTASNCTDVETEIDKKKCKLNKGNLNIKWSAIIQSDWEGRWKDRPIYYFIRVLFDKYFYKTHTQDFENHLVGDVKQLREQVEALLNLQTSKKG